MLGLLLGSHVAHGGGIPQHLCLHNPLHVRSPPVLLLICLSLLLLFILWQLKTFLTQTSPLLQASLSRRGKFQILVNLSDQDKVLPLILLQLLDHIFVNRLSHVHNL